MRDEIGRFADYSPSGHKLVPRLPGRSRSKPRRRQRRTPAQSFAFLLFGIHLVVAPQLIGGVFPWSMVAIASSALVCLLASVLTVHRSDFAPPAVIWVAIGLLGWTVLQATPLPCSIVATIARDAVAGVQAAHAALGEGAPSRCTISHDPGATQQEIIKGVAIVAALMTAWLLAANGSRRGVFWSVAASSLLMSLVALAHALLQLNEVFGVYEPVYATRQLVLAPLVNPNTLGAFAAVGACLWTGLTYGHNRREIRWAGILATIVTTATAFLSLSRGAIGQVVSSLLFLICFIQLTSRRSPHRATAGTLTRRLGVIASLALAVSIAIYVAGERVANDLAQEFERHDLSKLALIARAFTLTAEHPWFGVGRGAFSSAFVGIEGHTARFAYAENFVAQWMSEWGIPLTLVWLAAVSVALVPRLRQRTSIATTAAMVALLAYTAQNLVDLGFELLGTATIAAALLGAILRDGKSAGSKRSVVALRVSTGIVGSAGVAALLLLGPHLEERSVPSLETSLRASMEQGRREAFRDTLKVALALHPFEPVFPVLAATEALAHRDVKTPRWLNRAMQVAPGWPAPHLLAFQWLWRPGLADQATLELRVAAELDPRPKIISDSYCRVARYDAELALNALPVGDQRQNVFELASNCLPVEHPSAERLDDALLKEFPDSAVAQDRTAQRLALRGEVDESLAAFDRLLRQRPEYDPARFSRALVLERAGRFEELIAFAEREIPRVSDSRRPALLEVLGHAYARLGDTAGVSRIIGSHRRLLAGTARGLAESYALEGQLELELDHPGAAFSAFREAYRVNKGTLYLVTIAQIARRLGDHRQELWAYTRLCEENPTHPRFCSERNRLIDPQRVELQH